MDEKKWLKWAVGFSSVLAFTGFLYMTQKGNLHAEDSNAMEPETRNFADHDAIAGNYRLNNGFDDKKAEIFLFEAEQMEQILNWPDEQKAYRERLLEALNWDDDLDAEITMPAMADRSGYTSSNLRTRRS